MRHLLKVGNLLEGRAYFNLGIQKSGRCLLEGRAYLMKYGNRYEDHRYTQIVPLLHSNHCLCITF